MNFTPLIVMNAILFVIAILLAIAERLLVTYGECKIILRQEDEEKEIKVQGGNSLLTYLTAHNIKISSSCGGKGSCGYCKVRVMSGGGQLLPTEEIFMSREEKQNNMRLACQVKVKEDITIYIPDFLETIISMVKNQTFKTDRRWRITIE
jgi:Na+-transporting NADH:ubiquinone oxidoreductase subunit F